MRPQGPGGIDHLAAAAAGTMTVDMVAAVVVQHRYYLQPRCCHQASTDRGGGTVMAVADVGSRWAVCRRVQQYS